MSKSDSRGMRLAMIGTMLRFIQDGANSPATQIAKSGIGKRLADAYRDAVDLYKIEKSPEMKAALADAGNCLSVFEDAGWWTDPTGTRCDEKTPGAKWNPPDPPPLPPREYKKYLTRESVRHDVAEARRLLAAAMAIDNKTRRRTTTATKLKGKAKEAADFIRKNDGCYGEQIARAIDRTYEHFRSDIVPKLKANGFYNESGTGYHAPRAT